MNKNEEAMGIEFEDGTVSTLKESLEATDKAIAEQKEKIALGEALKRMEKFEEFQMIFQEKFFNEEADRLKDALTNPSIYKKEMVENMFDMMSSIRHVKQFLMYIKADADAAPQIIEDNENFRKEITRISAEDGIIDSE